MKEMLGVIGGMGPLASQLFYKLITEKTQAKQDQEHLNLLLYSDAAMPDRTLAILSGNPEEVTQRLLEDARLLEREGCKGIAITCNTAHYFADSLEQSLSIPVIHMIREAARKTAQTCKGKRAAVLATQGTVKTRLYQNALEEEGVIPYIPTEEGQQRVTHLIYDCVKSGKPADMGQWKLIEQELLEAGCEKALLACTELSCIREQENLGDFYLDPLEILAERCIVFMGGTIKEKNAGSPDAGIREREVEDRQQNGDQERKIAEYAMEGLRTLEGQTGFYYKNLVTGQEFQQNADGEFCSASVIKLPILLQILKWAEAGNANLGEQLTVTQQDKVPLSGALTLFSGEPQIDVETLCRLMISVSDNTATNVLIKRFGIEKLQRGFEEMGLRKTRLERAFFDDRPESGGLVNRICLREIAQLLESLYRGEMVSPAVSRQAMDMLLLQQFRFKMGGRLPESVPIASKTGEDDNLSHDVGIIFAKRPFLLCFAGCDTDVPKLESLMRKTGYEFYQEASL